MSYSVYLLACKNGSLYCGITTDLLRRYQEHLQGINCRYTRAFPPEQMVAAWDIEGGDKSLAQKIESFIKKQNRKSKERLIHTPDDLHSLLIENNIITDTVSIRNTLKNKV